MKITATQMQNQPGSITLRLWETAQQDVTILHVLCLEPIVQSHNAFAVCQEVFVRGQEVFARFLQVFVRSHNAFAVCQEVYVRSQNTFAVCQEVFVQIPNARVLCQEVFVRSQNARAVCQEVSVQCNDMFARFCNPKNIITKAYRLRCFTNPVKTNRFNS